MKYSDYEREIYLAANGASIHKIANLLSGVSGCLQLMSEDEEWAKKTLESQYFEIFKLTGVKIPIDLEL